MPVAVVAGEPALQRLALFDFVLLFEAAAWLHLRRLFAARAFVGRHALLLDPLHFLPHSLLLDLARPTRLTRLVLLVVVRPSVL